MWGALKREWEDMILRLDVKVKEKIVGLEGFCTAEKWHVDLSVIWRKKGFKEPDRVYIPQNDAVKLLNNRNLLTIGQISTISSYKTPIKHCDIYSVQLNINAVYAFQNWQ